MIGAPSYFEEVRCRASGRWDQLEQDPELAGPWHQLFKQVQSPRHVVSELLQNADDVGATKASVAIEDGDFVFKHNGEDFTEEHFASLCRFGYSKKRALHTIGFRGVGFKSTFSIGDKVCLRTPSLSVYFLRARFTEPIWQARNGIPGTCTEIRVAIRDHHRLRELEKNLEDWTKSPASLLFFRSIRGLSVQGQEIRWHVHSTGPVANSHWMALANDPDRKYLLIQWHNAIKYKQLVAREDLLPSWVVKFSALPCLQDTRGRYRQPAELLCRTPDIEALLDIEPFVRAELDTEANRQLLVMLGVRDTPTGPDKLLDRLQALSTVENAPVYEVEKWCNRLDQILTRCSTDEFQHIRNTFTHQKLILTAESKWACAPEVFLNADEEDAPGAAIVHPAIRHFSMWHKLGVAERPTAELSLKWLGGIESGKKLSKDELRRVRGMDKTTFGRLRSENLWLNTGKN